ncbi:hypothetical protein GCM10009677_30980 [Sphaerisporangium rubeum]
MVQQHRIAQLGHIAAEPVKIRRVEHLGPSLSIVSEERTYGMRRRFRRASPQVRVAGGGRPRRQGPPGPVPREGAGRRRGGGRRVRAWRISGMVHRGKRLARDVGEFALHSAHRGKLLVAKVGTVRG